MMRRTMMQPWQIGLLSGCLMLFGCQSNPSPPSLPQMCLVPTGGLVATVEPRCRVTTNEDLVLCIQKQVLALRQCNADKEATLTEVLKQKEIGK